jgi:polyisoprenoid-binding protein YceI
MRKTILGAIAAFLMLVPAAHAEMKTFMIDADHTTVGFSVRHMFTNLNGSFGSFSGAITLDAKNGIIGAGKVVVETDSVDTNHAKRDGHLKDEDFFNVKKFPTMTFVIHQSRMIGDSQEVTGELTLLGITKSVVFKTKFLGVGKDPWGNTRAGLTAHTRINRKDFGMDFNKVLDSGGLLIGDQVDITLEIEAIQAK